MHYQIEHTTRAPRGKFRTSGYCYMLNRDGKEIFFEEISRYNSNIINYCKGDKEHSLEFSYSWTQSTKPPSEGFCKRTISSSSNIPNMQDGYFYDWKGGGVYSVFIERVPDRIAPKGSNYEEVLTWYLKKTDTRSVFKV